MEAYLQSFYTVRFGDCDPFRHLNNARYIDYFLNAREDHLKEFYELDLATLYKKGQGWVVLQHEIIYLRPASFNERVCIRSGLLGYGPEHLQVEMLMLDTDQKQLKSLMHTRFVPISLATGKKEPHTREFMEFLSDKKLLDLMIPFHHPINVLNTGNHYCVLLKLYKTFYKPIRHSNTFIKP